MSSQTRTAVREPRRPLLVTADPLLLDDLLRLAAAGASEVDVAPDPAAARERWSTASFVLVGSDLVEGCVRAGLPRRVALILVARGCADEPSWAAAAQLRAEQVVVLPAAEAWLVDRFGAHVSDHAARGRVVCVLGGRGGAGASVLATALAVTARRRGLDTLLVDADPLGGGVDLVLGWERMQGLRWPELADASGRIDPPALVEALPGDGSLAVLSFDRSAVDKVPGAAMAAALDAGRRGRDLVIADLPRTFDEASLLGLASADRAYIVVPADVRSCAAARHIAGLAFIHCPALKVVVRGPLPGGLEADAVAEALGLPLAGVLRPDARLVRALGNGDPPAASGRGPLATLCRELLVDIRPRRHRAAA